MRLGGGGIFLCLGWRGYFNICVTGNGIESFYILLLGMSGCVCVMSACELVSVVVTLLVECVAPRVVSVQVTHVAAEVGRGCNPKIIKHPNRVGKESKCRYEYMYILYSSFNDRSLLSFARERKQRQRNALHRPRAVFKYNFLYISCINNCISNRI